MRRPFLFLTILLCAVTGWPAVPSGQGRPSLSGDLLKSGRPGERVRVIVQAPDGTEVSGLRGHLRGLVRRELKGAVALELSRADLDALSRDSAFAHISADMPVAPDMAITNKVTGASAVWQGTSSLLGSTPGYTGAGVGVAVVDSGIAPHNAIADRVVAHVNLVSWEPPTTGDPYGHGTHVAGIIGGNTTAAKYTTPAFAGGSAPGVRLIDVRVLGSNGMGYTSDVIAGIDWATANRAQYGIRVINLSLGHAVAESSVTDPLCQAVARAVKAGIVVVASAGNYGVTSTGAPVLGGITSPGNSPYALTVGAIDTAGTVDRSDDTIAPYSSRGPSAFDMGVKPDVVAPGTRLVSLEAQNSYLSLHYPTLAHRRLRQERVLPPERHEHVDGGRERRRRAAARRAGRPHARTGQGCAADGRLFRAGWRARGRRCGQRQLSAGVETRANRPGADTAHHRSADCSAPPAAPASATAAP